MEPLLKYYLKCFQFDFMASSSLSEYKKKRKFDKTPEPGPKKKRTRSGRIFVIQKHRATQLHYDFRLEADGVLKSWAVPKGPSLDPKVKRLAMQVEDHPVDYATFEGVIPEGEYGGGTVMVWDYGTYEPEDTDDVGKALEKGELKFSLNGQKLKGGWVLVRTRDRQWLLMKHRDYYTTDEEVTEIAPVSILTRRSLAEIAEDEGGNVKKAATGDPKTIPRRTGVKRRKKGQRAKIWHSDVR
jgi:bifunctional non-homologous end joining protein LigD